MTIESCYNCGGSLGTGIQAYYRILCDQCRVMTEERNVPYELVITDEIARRANPFTPTVSE